MVLFTIVSLIFIHVDFHDHAVTVVRFAFVNEKRVKEDNDAKGPETFPFRKLPPLVMMEILSYVGYRDLLNGFLMTNSEMMDVVRGLFPIRSVSADTTVDSRRIQALACPGSVVEYTGSV
jgi:hypothetical protein